jgi:hypothetical protein
MYYHDFDTYWKEFLRFDDIIVKDSQNEEKYKKIAKLSYEESKHRYQKPYSYDTTEYDWI